MTKGNDDPCIFPSYITAQTLTFRFAFDLNIMSSFEDNNLFDDPPSGVEAAVGGSEGALVDDPSAPNLDASSNGSAPAFASNGNQVSEAFLSDPNGNADPANNIAAAPLPPLPSKPSSPPAKKKPRKSKKSSDADEKDKAINYELTKPGAINTVKLDQDGTGADIIESIAGTAWTDLKLKQKLLFCKTFNISVPKKWRGNANIHKAIINHFKAETTSKWVRWLGHFHLDFI